MSDADNLFESVLITLFDMSFYNLDTISFLGRDSRSVQLEFNKYILPVKSMSAKAKQIIGIQVFNQKMFHNDVEKLIQSAS